MKNHPLFCDDPDNEEKCERDICFIQIFRFTGTKRTAIPKIYNAEDLLSIEALYEETGAGTFEIWGRDKNNRLIVDRCRIEIEGVAQPQQAATPPAAVVATPEPPPPQPGVSMLQGMGIQIPQSADPQTSLMFMILAQQQQSQQAAREDARASQNNLAQIFASFNAAQSQMVVGLAQAFGNRGGPPVGGESGTENAFIKGVETMSALVGGMREQEAAAAEDKPLNLGEVAKNIAQSLGAVRDIAQATSGSGPVIPPGGP